MKTSLVILLAVISAATCQPVYGADKDLFEDVNELLSTHWKIEALTHQLGFKSDISRTDLEASRSKLSQKIAGRSAGKLTADQVLHLLKPKADGTAPDWSPFRQMFKEQNDYLVESYLEPATQNGKSSGPQVVSGEVGRIQRKESRSIAIGAQSETLEIIWLSPRGTTYAGTLVGTKTSGSFIRPGIIVMEKTELDAMAQTPWVFRAQLEKSFGTNAVKAEQETVHRISSGLRPAESLSGLLIWRQLQATTVTANREATEKWMLDRSAYRTRLEKDETATRSLKALENKISHRNVVSLISDFGAMSRSETPLFIFSQILSKMEMKRAESVAVDFEEMALQSFSSYLQMQTEKYPALSRAPEEPDKHIVFAQLSRLSTSELKQLFSDFYEYYEAYWVLMGMQSEAANHEWPIAQCLAIQKRYATAAQTSPAVQAQVAEIFLYSNHSAEAERLIDELIQRLEISKPFLGGYELTVVPTALAGMAYSLAMDDDFTKAKAIVEKAVQLNPYHSLVRFDQGRVLAMANDLPASIKAFEECVRLEEAKSVKARNHGLWQEANRLKTALAEMLRKQSK